MRILVLSAAFLALSCASASVAGSHHASDPLHETLTAIRVAGTSLMSWWVDQPHVASPPRDPRQLPATFDWAGCRAVTAAEIRALVEPNYVVHLPVLDGWGYPLEFCLERDDPDAILVGIRSPGSDGRFDSGPYQQGEFPRSDPARDVVYLNGFFFSYPETASGG